MGLLGEDEHASQAALYEWWRLTQRHEPWLELFFAIPNGGARSAITGARLRAEGVRPGVPDMFLAWPSGGYHGLWLEMKTGRGRLSKAQAEMMARLRKAGYAACLCRGSAQASEMLLRYLAGEKMPE